MTVERMTSHRFVPAIEHAYSMIPATLHDRLRPDFLCGVDPVFAGLHGFVDMSYGRSYRETAHCAYEFHQPGLPKARRRTTIVLPTPEEPWVIVHELGHVLHQSLDFDPHPAPLNTYAETNWCEAFAEAFTAWVIPGYANTAGQQDPDTSRLLDSLAIF